MGKPGRKRRLGRPQQRLGDNMKMNLKEVECGGMDWLDLDQDRDRWQVLVNVVMNIWVP